MGSNFAIPHLQTESALSWSWRYAHPMIISQLVVWIGPTKIGYHGNDRGQISQKLYASRTTNAKNLAKIGRLNFEVIGLERIEKKSEAISAVRVIQGY